MKVNQLFESEPSKDTLLASYKDDEDYVIEIHDFVDWGKGMGRKGTMFYVAPSGERVKGGYWMDWPEDEWPIGPRDYKKKSKKERAAMEAKWQATNPRYKSLKDSMEFHRK